MENYEKIKKLAQKAGIADGKLNDEFLYTIQMVDYFYYNKNIGEIDIRENYVDGTSDGGIDYILNIDDVMYLIQGKSTTALSFEEIRNVFVKMDSTVNNFEKAKYDSYSNKLKSTFLNAYDDLSENKNITLVLFTNTTFSDELTKKIEDLKKEEYLSKYTIEVYDAKDIDNKITASAFMDDVVKEDKVNLSDANNYLEYGDNGIIINIKASSLKKLYTKHSKNGLFSYNLREHISQKNVDSGINETIKKDKENFWFYNNGITIGCEDFSLDGNVLKLYNFSIINGAQTTTKIGESKLIDSNYDFDLVCKVVRAKGKLKDDSDFIMKISEASNSQKPIKARDMKANAREQKVLQTKCAENSHPLAIEIKRGVKPPNFYKVEKWQRVTNEYIGQLILACLLQKPGTARSGKVTIFTSENYYNQIYKNRKLDCDILYELVKIGERYDQFKNEYSSSEKENVDRIAACKNGKLTTLAVVFYLYKRFSNIVDSFSDERLCEDNIADTKLTLEYKEDDYESKLNDLFKFIIKRLQSLYERKKETLKLTSYSNFFKTDKTYQEVILVDFDEVLKDDYDREKISEFMKIFNLEK